MRTSSFAVLSCLALLLTSTMPCECHATGEQGSSEIPSSTDSSGSSHPCGSHGHSDENLPTDPSSSGHNHGTDTSCCCSIQSPIGLFDTEVLHFAQLKVVPEPKLVPLSDGFWNFSNQFIKQFQIFPRGSPGRESTFAVFSSSSLSVRLQRWLI
ncbi:MAG: hypothetical protein KDD70_16480 [Bdellovibrionales bacterium]|nr:hypothetical protein [Bdellovibrionales bacterium]